MGDRTVNGEGSAQRTGTCSRGFTLVELLVVMAIIATLLSLVAPRYVRSVQAARESVLRTNLVGLRDAIDKFRADTGRFPESLDELAAKRYLREVPIDPVTDRMDTWVSVAPTCDAGSAVRCTGVGDVRSGAEGSGSDGTAYATW